MDFWARLRFVLEGTRDAKFLCLCSDDYRVWEAKSGERDPWFWRSLPVRGWDGQRSFLLTASIDNVNVHEF